MDHTVIIYRPKPPYLFSKHLELFSLNNEPVPYIYDRMGKSCRSIKRLGRKELFPVKCIFRGEPYDPVIECLAYGEFSSSSRIREYLKKHLRIDFDYNRFLEVIKDYPKLQGIVGKYPGLRPGRAMSLYEALIDAVVKQRISLKASLRITSRLVKRYGQHFTINNEDYYSTPLPERILDSTILELRKQGLTSVKARALWEIARAEYEGWLPSIREVERDPWRVVDELTGIYGVGPWTAELAVAMTLGDFRVGPRMDLAVRRGLSRFGFSVEELLRDEHLTEFIGLVMYLASIH